VQNDLGDYWIEYSDGLLNGATSDLLLLASYLIDPGATRGSEAFGTLSFTYDLSDFSSGSSETETTGVLVGTAGLGLLALGIARRRR
jgi:hypothetical protein